MKRTIGAALAAVTLVCAGTASAATIVGNLTNTGVVATTANALGMTSPGRWRISWELSAPATATQAGLLYEAEWDRWNKEGVTPEGNEHYEYDTWTFDQDGTSGFFEIGLRKPYKDYSKAPTGHWDVYRFHPTDFWMGFAGAPGAQYEITATFQSAIPEPATWAMMITGFGLTGAAIRRRKFQPVLSGRS